jgi:hypothetical protein
LLVSGGRLLVVSPWFDMDVGATASLGKRVEPGAAWHAQISARTDAASASLLFSRVEGRYFTPEGISPDTDCQFAFSAGVTPPQGSAKLSYTFTMERAGLAPGACRHTTQQVALALERTLLRAGGLQLLARVEGQKRIEHDEHGSRLETAGSRLLFRGRAGTVAALAGVGVQEGEGLGLFLSALVSSRGVIPRQAFDARLDRLDAGLPLLTTRSSVTLDVRNVTLALLLGVEDLPLADVARNLADHFRMQVTFSAHGDGDI